MNETITQAKQFPLAYPQKEGDISTFKNREDISGNSTLKSVSSFSLLPNLRSLPHLSTFTFPMVLGFWHLPVCLLTYPESHIPVN